MARNKILYIPIDFVGSDAKARKFSTKYADDLLQTQQKIRDGNYPISLALKTTLVQEDKSGWGTTRKGVEDFHEGIKRLTLGGLDFIAYDTYLSGPTRSMYGVLFDTGVIGAGSLGYTAIATGDLDQFPPDKNLEKIVELYDKTKTNEAILGVGSRNTHVVLAANEENAYLRRIFEGFMNLAIRKSAEHTGHSIIEADKEEAPDDPAYNSHGDFVTGVYLFNPDHHSSDNYITLLRSVGRKNGFFMFEDEYFMTIMAPVYGNLAATYFNSVTNPFDKEDPEEERKKILKKQIRDPLRSLRSTHAKQIILRTIREDSSKLVNFYTEEQLEEIKLQMLDVLE